MPDFAGDTAAGIQYSITVLTAPGKQNNQVKKIFFSYVICYKKKISYKLKNKFKLVKESYQKQNLGQIPKLNLVMLSDIHLKLLILCKLFLFIFSHVYICLKRTIFNSRKRLGGCLFTGDARLTYPIGKNVFL